jgi:hypothetical protein
VHFVENCFGGHLPASSRHSAQWGSEIEVEEVVGVEDSGAEAVAGAVAGALLAVEALEAEVGVVAVLGVVAGVVDVVVEEYRRGAECGAEPRC